MTEKQKHYMLACSEVADYLERAVISGWSLDKLTNEWAAHMAQVAREYDADAEVDDPKKYISMLEMQEIRRSVESDTGKRKFTIINYICDSPTE